MIISNQKSHSNPHPATPVLWPERDYILTEDNLISVLSKRGEEAEHRPVFVRPAQMVNHMTSGRRLDSMWLVYVCICIHACRYKRSVSDWDNGQQNIQ